MKERQNLEQAPRSDMEDIDDQGPVWMTSEKEIGLLRDYAKPIVENTRDLPLRSVGLAPGREDETIAFGSLEGKCTGADCESGTLEPGGIMPGFWKNTDPAPGDMAQSLVVAEMIPEKRTPGEMTPFEQDGSGKIQSGIRVDFAIRKARDQVEAQNTLEPVLVRAQGQDHPVGKGEMVNMERGKVDDLVRACKSAGHELAAGPKGKTQPEIGWGDEIVAEPVSFRPTQGPKPDPCRVVALFRGVPGIVRGR